MQAAAARTTLLVVCFRKTWTTGSMPDSSTVCTATEDGGEPSSACSNPSPRCMPAADTDTVTCALSSKRLHAPTYCQHCVRFVGAAGRVSQAGSRSRR